MVIDVLRTVFHIESGSSPNKHGENMVRDERGKRKNNGTDQYDLQQAVLQATEKMTTI